MVAADDHEHDGALEAHHRAADLRAQLELQLAQRLGAAVEPAQVRQDDRRAPAARREIPPIGGGSTGAGGGTTDAGVEPYRAQGSVRLVTGMTTG